jgi:hypothetical protein
MPSGQGAEQLLSLNLESKDRFDPKVIARALYKIGLGLVALEEGQAEACNSKYDLVREFIRGKIGRFPGNLLMAILPQDDPRVFAQLEKSGTGTVFATKQVAQVAFEIAGLKAGPQPSIPGPAFRPAIVEGNRGQQLSIFGTLFWVKLEGEPWLTPNEDGPIADIIRVYPLGG